MSVFDNVALAVDAVNKGLPAHERASITEELITLVNLSPARWKRPRELSGGMRQRVAIARALALDTPILLMDEPFGALDEQTRLLMGEWLVGVRRRTERTIVFVTHSLHEAIALSDRIAVMTARPGRIKDVIEVPLPYPRALDETAAVDLHAKLWAQVREESLRAMEGQS
jgi:ABC-type nitrate/sulfonate/bicarbonate transport system ATPase subunit